MRMRVLVIVVTYNGTPWLEKCLGSALLPGGEDLQTDVLVVDNCSSDGSPEFVKTHFPQVQLIENQDNAGFGAANNIGLREAIEEGYDFAYLLNQDAYLLPGTLAELVRAAAEAERFAVLSPLQMQPGGAEYDANFARRAVPAKLPSSLYEVPRVMAAHWLVRVEALKEVGIFAPIFKHYGEDDNLCDRLRAAGWKIGVLPSVKAIHDRALRREPKDKIIRRNYYVKSLADLCNPGRPLALQWAGVAVYTLVKTVKYLSFEPLRYFFRLISERKDILRTRRISKFA